MLAVDLIGKHYCSRRWTPLQSNNYMPQGSGSGKKVLKIAGSVLGAVALVYGLAVAGIYTAMCQPPETFGAIMSKVPGFAMMILPFRPLWMSARSGHLLVGDAAPDFSLPKLDGSGSVQLSSELKDHPVLLIFGSYT